MKFRYLIIIFLLFSVVAKGQFSYLDVLEDRDKIEIPFLYERGFIIVQLYLNNVLPLNFIFDTGAENTVLLEDLYAKIFQFEMDEKVNIVGSDFKRINVGHISRRVPLRFVKGGPFLLDMIVMKEQQIDFNNIIGQNIDGILGGNAFIGAVIEIDFRRNQIVLHRSDSFKPPKKHFKERVEIEKQRPFIKSRVTINDEGLETDIYLLMDTGAGLHVLIDEASHPDLAMPDTITDGRIGEGLGGQLGGFLGNVKQLRFMDETFDNLPVYFQKLDSLFGEKYITNKRNGLVGNVYWERKHVIIDYARGYLYTKDLYRRKKVFRFNKSGMVVFAIGHDLDKYIVKHVTPGSPSYIAGVRSGDIIRRFNRISSNLISLDFINNRLSNKEGKLIRMYLQRGDKKFHVDFRLKDKRLSKNDISLFD